VWGDNVSLPARSRLLGFSCPGCGLEYGSMSIEEHDKSRPNMNKERKDVQAKTHAIGKTHESYNNKERIGLKDATTAIKNIIRLKSEEFLASSYKDPRFIKMANLLPDTEKKKLNAIIDNINSNIQIRKITQQKQIEEEKTSSKWDVVEEELDINSREYKLMKKIHKIITAPTVLGIHDGKGFQERLEDNGRVIVTWNPIIEIKRYNRIGDITLHFDLKSKFNFITNKIIPKYPELTKHFSDENMAFIKKAFDLIGKYKQPFISKNWDYTWIEWFWIVRYSYAESPKRAVRMLQALDGKTKKISLKQIKNKSRETLEFLERFFYYYPRIIIFISKILEPILEKDIPLKEEYEAALKRDRQENEVNIGQIASKRWKEMMEYNNNNQSQLKEQKQMQFITNDAMDNNQDFVINIKDRGKRIRIYHYVNGKRKRCGPFKLSDLPIAAIMQLYNDGRIDKYD
jgi:hypothetical protein